MHNRGPNVINELLLDELLAIVNRVENFTHRQRSSSVLPNQTKTFLQLRRNRIFEPKQMKRFEALSQARCFDRRQPVMNIVQQGKIPAKFLPQPFEQSGDKIQVEL